MEALWIVVALLAAGGVGLPVTMLVLRLARSVDTAERRRAEPPEPADQPQFEAPAPPAEPPRAPVDALPPGVLRGGLVIGVLERLAVTVAILGELTGRDRLRRGGEGPGQVRGAEGVTRGLRALHHRDPGLHAVGRRCRVGRQGLPAVIHVG